MKLSPGIYILLLFVSFLLACESEVPFGPFSNEPLLHELWLSPDSLREHGDSLFIWVEYEDANGDIGFSSADQKSLWVKDSRLEEADLYHIAPLTPIGTSVHIQGRLKINLGSLFLISNDEEEQIVFQVKLRDREGNWSNELSSDTLYLGR